MGSGSEVVRETAGWLNRQGEKVGALQVLLFRPFSAEHFLAALPETVRSIAVLDRTKEPGAPMEPLHADVAGARGGLCRRPDQDHAARDRRALRPLLQGFHPGMVKAVFDELTKLSPRTGFTLGIIDDVSAIPASTTTGAWISSLRIPCAACSSAWAPMARWARTRTA